MYKILIGQLAIKNKLMHQKTRSYHLSVDTLNCRIYFKHYNYII